MFPRTDLGSMLSLCQGRVRHPQGALQLQRTQPWCRWGQTKDLQPSFIYERNSNTEVSDCANNDLSVRTVCICAHIHTAQSVSAYLLPQGSAHMGEWVRQNVILSYHTIDLKSDVTVWEKTIKCNKRRNPRSSLQGVSRYTGSDDYCDVFKNEMLICW